MARAVSQPTSRTVPSLGEYTRAIWRRKLVVAAGLVLGLALGAVVLPTARISQATYQATVRLKVVELVSDTIVRERPQFDTGRDTETGDNALQDVDVTRRILQRLGGEAAGLEAADVAARLTATPVARSPYVDLTYTDTDQLRTREIVYTYAKAWASRRNALDAKRLKGALAGVDSQVGDLQGQVAGLSGVAVTNPARQAELTRVQARLGVLVRLRDDIVRQQLFLGAPTGVVGNPVVSQLSGPTPRILVLVLGLLIGLLAGIGLSLLLEAARPSVVTPVDAERATGVQVIASVPRSGMRGGLPVVKRPFSPAAEGYRRVAGALERRGLGDEVRKLAIASADPGEGRSLLAANLAHSLARKGHDVVLVSADLRNPTVDALLGLDDDAPGLAEWLQDDPDDTPPPLCAVADRLLLLPAGRTSRNPGELLTAGRLRKGLQPLVDAGSIVLIDTPPALGWAEAMTLTAVADATVLVARARASRWRAIEQLAEMLRRDGVREIGMVLLGDRRHSASGARKRFGLGSTGRHQLGVRTDPNPPRVPSSPPVSPTFPVPPVRPASPEPSGSPAPSTPWVPPVPPVPRPARRGGAGAGPSHDQSNADLQWFSGRFEPLTTQDDASPAAVDPKAPSEGEEKRATSWTPAAGGSYWTEHHD